jgi:hypothetical protein
MPKYAELALFAVLVTSITRADPPSFIPQLPDQREIEAQKTRSALFTGPLKDGSLFGLAWFPETLRAPEMDLEYSEARLDWFHSEKSGRQFDEIKGEIEQAFGALTLEVELPYQIDKHRAMEDEPAGRDEGFSRIEFGVRYPLAQFLSADHRIDYTLVAAMELALPTNTPFSRDTELSPRLYQLLRLGDHVAAQASAAYEAFIGPDAGGSSTLEYAVSLGYVIPRSELPLPAVLSFCPMAELLGEHGFNGPEKGDRLFGVAGFRLNMESFKWFQPRIGIGYEFPINAGARDELRWGIVTSLVFEL